MIERTDITIPMEGQAVSGLSLLPDDAWAVYVLAHGAGAGMRHPFMAAVAEALAAEGVATLRYQFPYMETGKRRPDLPAVAVATVRAAVTCAAELAAGLPLFAGGKSFGGRMTSTAAAAGLAAVHGLVFLGFPLHPPKRPAISRADHLTDVEAPMLFLQGTRDDLADIDLMRQVTERLGPRAKLHELADASHGFAVPKRTGRTDGDVIAELTRVGSGWMKDIAARG